MNSFLAEMSKHAVPREVLDEASNVVLAYCMAAVFLTKNQSVQIDENHFYRLLDYIASGKTSVNFVSEESASTTHDLISLRTPMSDAARNFILNELDPEGSYFVIVESIIQFLNENSSFNTLVAQVTNNGIRNRIVIDVENISADEPNMTSVLIDNEHVRVFYNVRPIYDFRTGIGGIGKKELDKDYGYDSHRNFLKTALGLDIGPDSAVYYQNSHNNGQPTVETLEAATRKLYGDVCRRINDGLNGAFDSPLNDFRHNILTTMLNCCYGVNTDQDCTCIVIPSKEANHQSFNVQEVYEKLYKQKLKAKCPDHTNPSIRIVDENNKELFQVRFKKEKYGENVTGHRYKMYFKPSKLDEYF